MAVTEASFRTDFSEFSNTTAFPTGDVNFWLAVGVKMINPARWGDFADIGVELFAAHNLALGAQAKKSAQFGGIPGLSTGLVASKSVDKVSVAYDTAGASVEGAGHWNLTTYGTRFKYFINLFGAGPWQIGTPPQPDVSMYTGANPYLLFGSGI